MGNPPKQIGRNSVVDQVVRAMREDLMSGTIPPGGRILTSELCARFEVSHIPVREALRRLEGEGLVANTPQGATLASSISVEDASSLYDLRRLIEIPVARRGLERVNSRDIAALQAALKRLQHPQQSLLSGEYWEAHREFHWLVLAPGATEWVGRVLDQLWRSCERFVRISALMLGTMSEANEDHAEMVDAIAAGDGEHLERVMVRHLNRTEQALMRVQDVHHLVSLDGLGPAALERRASGGSE